VCASGVRYLARALDIDCGLAAVTAAAGTLVNISSGRRLWSSERQHHRGTAVDRCPPLVPRRRPTLAAAAAGITADSDADYRRDSTDNVDGGDGGDGDHDDHRGRRRAHDGYGGDRDGSVSGTGCDECDGRVSVGSQAQVQRTRSRTVRGEGAQHAPVPRPYKV